MVVAAGAAVGRAVVKAAVDASTRCSQDTYQRWCTFPPKPEDAARTMPGRVLMAKAVV